jgi:hypothetical protein
MTAVGQNRQHSSCRRYTAYASGWSVNVLDELLRLMHLDTRGALEGYLREKMFQSAGKALLAVIKIKGKD